MESKVTAIQMRKKFGSILDRVVEKGEHITIMRGNLPLATLIPAQEHERQCSTNQKIKTIEEALLELEAWKKKNPSIVKKMAETDSTEIIRKMRGLRWSSSIPRSR